MSRKSPIEKLKEREGILRERVKDLRMISTTFSSSFTEQDETSLLVFCSDPDKSMNELQDELIYENVNIQLRDLDLYREAIARCVKINLMILALRIRNSEHDKA